MANLKNITELPVAESADGLNLIVNDNGVAKQIAASEVGAQADWNIMDESSPAFVKNKPTVVSSWNELADKPFGEEEGKIVVIPETTGAVVASNTRIEFDYSLLDWTEGNVYFIKWDGVEHECTCYENNDGFMVYAFTLPDGNTIEFWDHGAIYTNRGSSTGGLVVGDTHTYEVYAYGTVVKAIEKKYLPAEEWDLDLTVDMPWNEETSEPDMPIFTAAAGYSYNAFIAKIEAGESPKIRCKLNVYESDGNMFNVINALTWIEKNSLDCYIAIVSPGGFIYAYLKDDNTIIAD